MKNCPKCKSDHVYLGRSADGDRMGMCGDCGFQAKRFNEYKVAGAAEKAMKAWGQSEYIEPLTVEMLKGDVLKQEQEIFDLTTQLAQAEKENDRLNDIIINKSAVMVANEALKREAAEKERDEAIAGMNKSRKCATASCDNVVGNDYCSTCRKLWES